MNYVIYYSCTGQSKAVAEHLSERLNYPVKDLTTCNTYRFDDLVLVFPIYCQNVPAPVCSFLEKSTIKNLSLVATFGRMNHGNVLYEIQTRYKNNIVAAAYIPTKHSYLDNDVFSDYNTLETLIKKIKKANTTVISRSGKNVFASFFPSLRSRLGVKIILNEKCNGCGTCEKLCDYKAIFKGVTNKKCIRCLKCVKSCPQKALEFRLSPPLKAYLRKKPVEKIEIY